MFSRIKLFLSRFTNKPIFKGYGITIPHPDTVMINKDLSLPDLNNQLCFYKTNPNVIVELVDIYVSRKKRIIYKFRNIKTNTSFVICEDGFNILFDTNPLESELNYTGLKNNDTI